MRGAGLGAQILAGLAALLVTAPDDAVAAPCSSHQREAGVPARLTKGPAELGMIPEACPGNEILLRGWGAVLVAEEDFYGSLYAGGALRFRMAHPSGPWFALWMPGLEYRFVANATVEGDGAEMSAGSIGGHVPVQLDDDAQLAPFGRVLLPTESVYRRATRYGIDVGTSGVWRLHPLLELVGGLSAPVLVTANRPAVHWVVLPTLGGDLLFEPWSFLAVGGGAAVRYRAGNSPAFESFDPRMTLRFYAGPALLDLAAAAPLFGADRTDLLLSASLGWIGF